MEVISMNSDQVKGKAEQVVGKIKQGTGEALGNDSLANRGVVDQVKGAARETWGNVKDAAHSEHKEHANDARDRVVQKTEELKERANENIDKHKR
jgi:uncharacterized protein YjbJ (UPF0337 family)